MTPEERLPGICAYALFKLNPDGRMEQNWLINSKGYVVTLKEAQDYQLLELLKSVRWEIFCLEFPV